MKNNRLLIIIISLSLLIALSGCERRYRQDVLMLYPSWAEGIAITNLAKVMIEEKGYTVVMKRIEPGPIFASLSRGDADVCMDIWLPHTHKDYWARFGDKLEVLGTVFDDGMTGLVVPTYVDINSIEELNTNKDRFDNKIYGIASGAGIHSNTLRAIDKYQLDFEQLTSSETSMVTALRKAVAQKEWVVVTGWKPHYIWSDYDLKPLEDPKGVYPTDEIKIISRLGFEADQPEIANFLKNFTLSEVLLNELIDDMGSDKDATVGATKFYNKYKNEPVLDFWKGKD